MNNLRPRCSMHNGIIPMQHNQIVQTSNLKSAYFHASDAVKRSFVAGLAPIIMSIHHTLLRPKYIKQRTDSFVH